jgi:hypothetical protein
VLSNPKLREGGQMSQPAPPAQPGQPPPAQPGQPPAADPATDQMRIKYGAWLIGVAFLFLLLVLVVALFQFDASEDVVAVVGAVTGVVGTIIGAFFGVQVGRADKEEESTRRVEAERKAEAYAGALDPGMAEEVRREMAS